jgi:hypothetical protein
MADVTDVNRYVPSDAMQEIESGIDHLPSSVVNYQVKAVDSDIKAKERLLVLAEQQANEFKDRITVMHEHLLNVQQELVHTQQLLDSKQREIETEVHLKQLSEREAGKIAQEVVQTEKEMLEVQDALNIVQNNIFRGNERLDQFKMQLNWNQEELEQWTLAAKQKEEDNKALQKYAHADEQKIKELVLAGEKINMEVQRKKIDLENEVTETQASQVSGSACRTAATYSAPAACSMQRGRVTRHTHARGMQRTRGRHHASMRGAADRARQDRRGVPQASSRATGVRAAVGAGAPHSQLDGCVTGARLPWWGWQAIEAIKNRDAAIQQVCA